MAVLGVMVTPDGVWRVERVRDAKGLGYVVIYKGHTVRRCATSEQVAEAMAAIGGDIADLVPD